MRRKVITALSAALSAALVFSQAGPVFGALREITFRQGISNSIAAMRYITQQKNKAEDRIKLVTNSIVLTKQQRDVESALLDKTMTDEMPQKVRDVRVQRYKSTLGRLDFQLREMTKVDFVKIYGDRIAQLNKDMDYQQILLEAKLTEYRVQFGGEPPVNLEIQEKLNRFRSSTEGAGILEVR
jgi:hypothetical protein